MRPQQIGVGLTIVVTIYTTSPVRAEVCSITSVTGVAFGSYDVFDASPLLAAGSVNYECTGVLPTDRVMIELDGTTDASTLRAMTAGTRMLGYQLYLDAARTLVWGTGSGGTATYGPIHPVEGTLTVVNIYGAMPAHQDASVGSYSGIVIVTLQL